jgi:hypothetical protein
MVCENTSSGVGQKVGQGYYDGGCTSQVVSMKLCMEWTNEARSPLALSEEVTRPSLKKAGHVIVHFDPKVKLHLDCIFVSMNKT